MSSEAAANETPDAVEPAAPLGSPQPAPAGDPPGAVFDKRLEALPGYTRSLLRVVVPVSVTLASSREPVRKILRLTPGGILAFDKSCEERLSLEVNGRPIAEGEAVKVGDKFGLRITSIKLPGERFRQVDADDHS